MTGIAGIGEHIQPTLNISTQIAEESVAWTATVAVNGGPLNPRAKNSCVANMHPH